MTFNTLMVLMAGFGLLLLMAGFIRNMSPACKDKTRWGWFVVGLPFYVIPFGVAFHRAVMA